MEVNKELRHHTILVAAVILIVSVVSISVTAHNAKALVSRPFSIEPTRNGLAKITNNNSLNDSWIQAAQETELNLSLR